MKKLQIKWLLVLAALLLTLPIMAACAQQAPAPAPTPAPAPAPAPTPEPAKARYIFLFIGDGMGMPQRNSAEVFIASTNGHADPTAIKLVMNQFPAQGMSTTYAADAVITDSAASATALACGYKTNSGVVAMDPGKTKKFKTMAEMAKEKGMKVGIVSSVSIDHATPACFYAHQPTRKNYYEIGMELAKSNFDYYAGGALLSPKGSKGDQPDVYQTAAANGFTITKDKAEFNQLRPGTGKVWATTTVQDSKALYYELDRKSDHISLAEFTAKGIELLDNPYGFFMMVEGGKIDWACHANDASSSIWDTIAFDAAAAEAVKFYKKHPNETLIVVTGDHECGGMTIGFAGTKYGSFFEKVSYQTMSYVEFDKQLAAYKEETTAENASLDDILPMIQQAFGLRVITVGDRAKLEEKAKAGDVEAEKMLGMTLSAYEVEMVQDAFEQGMMDEEVRASDDSTYLLYGGYEPLSVTLTHILNQKAGIAWTSYSHTGVPVPVSAIGVGQEQFNGYYDNTDVAKKMMAIAGWK